MPLRPVTSVRRLGSPIAKAAFEVSPLRPFGAEIIGADLGGSISASSDLAQNLRRELDAHGLLVVRNQKFLPDDHLAVSSIFGEIFPLPPRYQHERSPHPTRILRMSNDVSEGFQGVGTTGWHVDGTSYATPFCAAVMHMDRVPRGAAPTLFLPLAPLARHLRAARPEWERLWLRCSSSDDAILHPLLFAHPRTGAPSVTLGKTYGSVWRGGGPERAAGADETAATVADLRTLVDDFVASAAQPVYRHDWREGDVVLVDNLATAHLAPPETQRPAAEIGLRVLHRVVVAGTAALAPFFTSESS